MIRPQISQMNADFQKANRDPQTCAIIGAVMEAHRIENLRESAEKIKNINLTGVSIG